MRKLTYEYVKKQIENVEGYTLLSTKYKNNRTKLKIQCDKTHKFLMCYSEFQQGQRCSICRYTKIADKCKNSYQYIKEQIESDGSTTLLSKDYKNNITKMSMKCNKYGHKFLMNWKSFKNGCRCPICEGSQKLLYQYIKEQIESDESTILISKDYKNNSTKLEMKCVEHGHKFFKSYIAFKSGQRCTICWKERSFSKGEKEVLEVVKTLTTETIVENDRTQIVNPKTGKNLELDIWIPHMKKAMEYNGEYWHSDEYTKYKDEQKVIQCREKGIDLMVIKEQEWIDNKNKYINNIKYFLEVL